MRVSDMEQDRREFAEFYARARDDCLRIVLVSVGDRELAEDLVAEAFTKAWMGWRVRQRHVGEALASRAGVRIFRRVLDPCQNEQPVIAVPLRAIDPGHQRYAAVTHRRPADQVSAYPQVDNSICKAGVRDSRPTSAHG